MTATLLYYFDVLSTGESMRGISPIVSTILMVAIAIAAAIVLYYIVMGVMSQQQATLEEQASKPFDQMSIDAWKYDSANNTVTIYVRNMTDHVITLSAAMVTNPDGTVVCQASPGLPIEAHKTEAVEIDTCTLTAGNYYDLKVTSTNNGVAAKRVLYQG